MLVLLAGGLGHGLGHVDALLHGDVLADLDGHLDGGLLGHLDALLLGDLGTLGVNHSPGDVLALGLGDSAAAGHLDVPEGKGTHSCESELCKGIFFF